MKNNTVEMTIQINGRAIEEYRHQNQTWVEGRQGSDYELAFRNDSYTRRKLVISVDGLNVLTGDSNWERGYVIDPWSHVSIPGWRINSNEVAKFVFSSIPNTYNQQNVAGDKANIGVIGCMVFDQKVPINWQLTYTGLPPSWNWGDNTTGGNANFGVLRSGMSTPVSYGCGVDFLEQQSAGESSSVGTGWGDSKGFKTKEVSYDFYPLASDTLLAYYDDFKGLVRRGIDTGVKVRPQWKPNPFPGYRDGCPFPVRK